MDNQASNNSEINISILTATFNRPDTLKRMLASLDKSNYRHFKSVIGIDGSSPEIIKAINECQKKYSFPIIYFCYPHIFNNGVMNDLISKCDTEYCFILDDDDELTPNAMDDCLNVFKTLDKKVYRSVIGRVIDTSTGKPATAEVPENINAFSWKKAQRIADKIRGEKYGMLYTPILKKFKWPECPGINRVSDDLLWFQINSRYREYYFNNILRIFHTDHPSLGKQPRVHQWFKNVYFDSTFWINNQDLYTKYRYLTPRFRLKQAAVSLFLSKMEKDEIGRNVRFIDKFLLCLLWPAMLAGRIFLKEKKEKYTI